jgi:uncharacterized protein (TIGR02594 family)
MTKWIDEARKLIGTHEGAGKADNPRVVALFKDAGCPEVKHDSTAWCAAFIGACLHRAGLRGTGSLWALDYANWGVRLEHPAFGCIATKKRKNKLGKTIGGHVFFVVGWDKAFVYALGGNQNDQVSIVKYPRSVVTAWRWPPGVPLPTSYPGKLNPGDFTSAGRED